MDLAGQSVVVVGLARSGVAAAHFLTRLGARVVATDRKPAGELEAEALSLEKEGALLELGGHQAGTFMKAALVVVSPGVPWDLPELEAARRAGVPVMAELEFGYRQLQGTVAAVTGTKGKSTTTAALGAMLRATAGEVGEDVRVGGNIGEALTGLVEAASPRTIFVLETSSFQLEGIETFHPHVAVFLNLAADHLDRHQSFADYARAKARIFRNQTREDWAVVNADDPAVLTLAREGRARLLAFHPAPERPRNLSEDAAFFESGEARLRLGGRTETLFSCAEVRVPGHHLTADLLAAAASARLLGASPDAVARAVREFAGAEHVLEHVADVRGVAFFNDSKATNLMAARKSLEAFPGPVLLIMGGRHKGGDFAELREAVTRRARTILAIGEARPSIGAALSAAVPVIPCDTLDEAVERAFARAQPGDTVLLAPACSSFDMFEDYAERGRAFKAAVQRLAEREDGRDG